MAGTAAALVAVVLLAVGGSFLTTGESDRRGTAEALAVPLLAGGAGLLALAAPLVLLGAGAASREGRPDAAGSY